MTAIDFQKHGFWIALGAVLVLEVGFLVLFVFPADGSVSKREAAIKRHLNSLQQQSTTGAIPNAQNIADVNRRHAQAARYLLRSVIHLAGMDQMHLEGRVGGMDQPASIRTHFATVERKLKQQLAKGEGVYAGLRLTNKEDAAGNVVEAMLGWPDKPEDEEDVADFYRKWWAMRMMIDKVLAPVSRKAVEDSPDKKPWELYEINWGDDEAGEGYVNQYLRIKVVLNIRMTDLHKLLHGLINTGFLVLPETLVVRQAKPDPRVIEIKVEFNQPDPEPPVLVKKASRQRPLVEVELTARVVDLDREKLISIGRRFRKDLGGKDAFERLIDDLKQQKDFLEGFSDKAEFLDTMKVELLK